MTTTNISIDYAASERAALSPVILMSNPGQRPAPAFGLRRSGTDLEHADLAAAREFGEKRRQAAVAGQDAHSKSAVEGRGWLAGDPFRWRGRKIMNRGSGALFSVRQVFNSGKVELQKKFMLYLSDVETIRKDYEPAI